MNRLFLAVYCSGGGGVRTKLVVGELMNEKVVMQVVVIAHSMRQRVISGK